MSRTEKDRKPKYWSKLRGIPSSFKKLEKKRRRAKEKQAVRRGEEPPRTRKSDHWHWW